MTYIDYIKLGFERTDTSDSVEFDRTGYYGYILTKKLTKSAFIELSASEFDYPKLYIKQNHDGNCIILPISIHQVEILSEK